MTSIKTFETLYNTTIGTGREKQWSVEVLETGEGTYIVRASHGIRDGKLVVHDSEVTEGKNIGKSNETTPRQQALLEAERDWTKKVKSGYAPEKTVPAVKKKLIRKPKTIDTVVEVYKSEESDDDVAAAQVTTESKKMLKPMLALEMDTDKLSIKFPAFVQPKLDGVRCLVYRDNTTGKLIFQSRSNTIYEPFAHLLTEFEALFTSFDDSDDLIIDGELYTHGMAFEKITSMARRSKTKHGEVGELQHHIYDCFYSGTKNLEKNKIGYADRYAALLSAFSKTPHTNIVLVETKLANSLEDVYAFHTHYTTLSAPYEGVMIRGKDSPYKQQGRSKELLKYKMFSDDEFVVIGHHEGTGAHAGTPIFECSSKVKKDKNFSVTMQGSIEGRKKMFENVQSYYGKKLTVKYQEITADGVPRFPVGLAFRDYE
jgi:ATP-dependent DNA ligase